MSVDVENWMVADGLTDVHYVGVNEGARRIRVGELRAQGMMVGWDPDGGHQHHAAVWHVPSSRSGRRRIHRCTTVVKLADGELPEDDSAAGS